MRIIVKVKPNAKADSVERVSQQSLLLEDKAEMGVYKVSVKAPPVDGKANIAVKKVLADYFYVAPSLVSLVSGSTVKNKIFEILK